MSSAHGLILYVSNWIFLVCYKMSWTKKVVISNAKEPMRLPKVKWRALLGSPLGYSQFKALVSFCGTFNAYFQSMFLELGCYF